MLGVDINKDLFQHLKLLHGLADYTYVEFMNVIRTIICNYDPMLWVFALILDVTKNV